MTNDKVSIRWKLCAYFLCFSAILLVILWVLQTVLFDSIYGLYKKNSLVKQSAVIASNIDNTELDSLLTTLSQENNFSVYIVGCDGTLKTVSERSTTVRVDKASSYMYGFWDLAAESDGLYVDEIKSAGLVNDNGTAMEYDPSHFTGNVPQKAPFNDVVCARIASSSSGSDYLVVLISRLEPISSTTEVLRIILFSVTGIMAVLSVIVALLASKNVSQPLSQLSVSARQLAKGNYNVVFYGGGCSEIAQLTETLNHTAKELSKMEKLRRELIANVSHDLRTPLTMIGGYGEMMRDIPGENNAENIQIIIDESKRLTKLVNDTLDLSKLQSGAYEVTPTVFSLTDSAAENVFVSADESTVNEAIYNLVSNAVTHSGDSASVTVRQELRAGKVRISVIDNGPGIPPEDLSEIWDRYRKGSGSGTGLGLAIVKAAIEVSGGTYGVMSTVGQGSEFWFELPTTEAPKQLPE